MNKLLTFVLINLLSFSVSALTFTNSNTSSGSENISNQENLNSKQVIKLSTEKKDTKFIRGLKKSIDFETKKLKVFRKKLKDLEIDSFIVLADKLISGIENNTNPSDIDLRNYRERLKDFNLIVFRAIVNKEKKVEEKKIVDAKKAEEIIFKLLKGQPVSDVYHQEVDFIDIYTYSFDCHFGVRIKNSTSTDVIIYEASIQTPKNWMQKFSDNNFDKESVLQNKGITSASISYGSNFGFSNGFSGIKINSGETWRPSRGWGPGFIFKLKIPLSPNEVDYLSQKYTCSLIDEVEIGLNFNDIDFIKFRDNRDLSDIDIHEFFKMESSREKGSNAIGQISSYVKNYNLDWFEDYGFKFD